MDEEEKLQCMGILKGIYKFEKEATTEFQDWSGDDPHVYFIQVFEEWEKGNKDLNNLDEMHLFIKKNCAKWYKDIEKRWTDSLICFILKRHGSPAPQAQNII
jgi:hypothetical protein